MQQCVIQDVYGLFEWDNTVVVAVDWLKLFSYMLFLSMVILPCCSFVTFLSWISLGSPIGPLYKLIQEFMNSKNAWQKIPGVICEAMVNCRKSEVGPEREGQKGRDR